MAYPLIILGAGASFDSLDLNQISRVEKNSIEPYRPPVADDLLKWGLWDRHIKNWDEIKNLAADVIGGISRKGGLEQYLTHLNNKVAPNNPKRYKELFAMRFYLVTLFSEISEKYFHPASNYLALLKRIEDEASNKAIFVNFNYDLLLEKHISNIREAQVVDDFISSSIKVIKIHGSCNWVHQPIPIMSFPGMENTNSYVFYVSQAEKYSKNIPPLNPKIETNLRQFSYPIGNGRINHYLPAVTIPLSGKHQFICPTTHIETLKGELNQIDRILVIGWRAQDLNLLDILNNLNFAKEIKLFVVSADLDSSGKVIEEFKNKAFKLSACGAKGFSNFIASKEFDGFWK